MFSVRDNYIRVTPSNHYDPNMAPFSYACRACRNASQSSSNSCKVGRTFEGFERLGVGGYHAAAFFVNRKDNRDCGFEPVSMDLR